MSDQPTADLGSLPPAQLYDVDNPVMRMRAAQALLSHPLMAEAFRVLEEEAIRRWRNSKADETDARERIYTLLYATKRVKEHLETIITTGKVDMKLDQMAHEQGGKGAARGFV